jgi:hypothetical protein
MFGILSLTAAELPAWLELLLQLWPIGALALAIFAAIAGLRYFEKANINKTNAANIEALEKLVATRDREISDRDETIVEIDAKFLDKCKLYDTLEIEYKTLAGIMLSELLVWAGRYDSHVSSMNAKDQEIRVLTKRIEYMEMREAENDAVHKSQ